MTSAMIAIEITPLIDEAMMISTRSAGTVSRVSTTMRTNASNAPPTEPAHHAQDTADHQAEAAGQESDCQCQRQSGHHHRQQVAPLIVAAERESESRRHARDVRKWLGTLDVDEMRADGSNQQQCAHQHDARPRAADCAGNTPRWHSAAGAHPAPACPRRAPAAWARLMVVLIRLAGTRCAGRATGTPGRSPASRA